MRISSQILTSDLSLKGNSSILNILPQEVNEYAEHNKLCIKEKIRNNLNECGVIVKRNWYCKKCEKLDLPALLRVDKAVKLNCQQRYCSNPDCVNTRFSRLFENLKEAQIKAIDENGNNKTFEDGTDVLYALSLYPNLLHMTIGFNHIKIEDFKIAKKNHSRNINLLIRGLKKQGVIINGIKVLDISMGKNTGIWDGTYYVHYHIIALPFKTQEVRGSMIKIKAMEKKVNSRPNNQYPMFVKLHTKKNTFYTKREALLSYVSIRAVGLYKPYESKERDYKLTPKKLKDSLEQGKYVPLNKIINFDQYVDWFYKQRMFNVVGSRIVIPQCSSLVDNDPVKHPTECKCHGHLERNDLRVEYEYPTIAETPPDRPETITYTIEHIKPSSNEKQNINQFPQTYEKLLHLGIKVKGINC